MFVSSRNAKILDAEQRRAEPSVLILGLDKDSIHIFAIILPCAMRDYEAPAGKTYQTSLFVFSNPTTVCSEDFPRITA